MRVLVLGGYGLIGLPTVLKLIEAGHYVTGIGRSVDAASFSVPAARWLAQDISHLKTPKDWFDLLAGFDAVVNCSGALQDSSRDDLQALQSDAMKALFEACRIVGIRRVVQVSAAGVSPDAGTAFFRTKADADAALMGSDLEWVILRPGLVISPAAYGGTALLRGLASFPYLVPIVSGTKPIQTVSVDDVADAILASVEGKVPARRSYDLVEDHPSSLKELVREFRCWLGREPAPVILVPAWIGRIASAAGDALSHLGWRPPLRTTAIRQLEDGVQGDPTAWREVQERPLSTIHETLRRYPASVQERWFGRMWLLKPAIIATLSLFWLASGLIGLVETGAATSVLTERGFGQGLAMAAVLVGSLVDIALGLMMMARSTHRKAAVGMIAVTLGYLGAGSLFTPDLWLDPLGPFVKTIPGAVLALVALAVSQER